MTVGKCYKFRAFGTRKNYLWDYSAALYSGAAAGKKATWQVLKGKIGRNTITLASRLRRGRVLRH
jgi:hypothetical protein